MLLFMTGLAEPFLMNHPMQIFRAMTPPRIKDVTTIPNPVTPMARFMILTLRGPEMYFHRERYGDFGVIFQNLRFWMTKIICFRSQMLFPGLRGSLVKQMPVIPGLSLSSMMLSEIIRAAKEQLPYPFH